MYPGYIVFMQYSKKNKKKKQEVHYASVCIFDNRHVAVSVRQSNLIHLMYPVCFDVPTARMYYVFAISIKLGF